MAEIRVTFFQECEEQRAALEAGLITMDEGDASPETINAVFRAAHLIKGGAGAFKLAQLVDFAHVFETALDRVRSGRLTPDGDVMRLLLRAADVLADLVAAARDDRVADAGGHEAISSELGALLDDGGEEEDDGGAVDFAPIAVMFDDLTAPLPDGRQSFTITFRPHRSLFKKANEPLALLRELARLGDLELACDTSQLPLIDELDPGEPHLAWTGRLVTESGEAAVREVFEFVEGDCDLIIAPEPAELIPPQLDEALPPPAEAPAAPAVEEAAAAQSASTPRASGKAAAVQATIRVDLERVDRLINLVGELVINQAMLSQRVH